MDVQQLGSYLSVGGRSNSWETAKSSIELDADQAVGIEELRYNQVSNVNVSNFVTVKLSGRSNYTMWSTQMKCLIDQSSHEIYGTIIDGHDWPMTMSDKIIERYESLVSGWIIGSLDQEVLKHVHLYGQPRKLWTKLQDSYSTSQFIYKTPYSVIQILEDIVAGNNDGDTKLETKLRNVILEGQWWKAEALLNKHQDAITMAINDNGDTMLHLAVRQGHNNYVKNLLSFIRDGKHIEHKNSFGETALHAAAMVDNKYAAKLLVEKRKALLGIEDNNEDVPLTVAYDNRQLSTFVYLFEPTEKWLGHLPSKFSKETGVLAYVISMKQYDLALKLLQIDSLFDLATKDDTLLMALTRNFPYELSFLEALIYPSLNCIRQKIVKRSSMVLNSLEHLYRKAENILWSMRSCKNTYYSWLLPAMALVLLVPVAVFYLIYQLIFLLILVLLFPFFKSYAHLWKVLVFVVRPINRIEKKRKDYKEAKELLKLICDKINEFPDHDCYKFYKRPIAEAARLDVYEVVVQILRGYIYAIKNVDERWHNVVQLSVIHRSIKVYNLLSPLIRGKFHRNMTDSSGNNMAHLAGRLAPSFVLSRSTGAALQLQRELQWFEDVKKHMTPAELIHENHDMETSQKMFTREHADLLKEGENWMKTTAESCSITAALIVTVVFAAAITVPGGNNQETGIPMFKKEIAFIIFAISDALSLFTAATALLVFLSILTTRFAEKDFLFSLPRRLIIGLCALFISTTAMMVAFGAILFLVFCDQRTWMLAPIGLFACMPILVIVTLQLPLVVDLIRSTYFSIFEQKKRHRRSSPYDKEV